MDDKTDRLLDWKDSNENWENATENKDTEQNNNEAYNRIEDTSENTNENLKEDFGVSKEDILNQLSVAKNIEQNVKTFSKWADKYWIEAILSWIPLLWDLWPALFSTCFLFYQWYKAWLTTQDMLKIFWYQAADFLVWSIPVAWNIVDFFFQSNKYSSRVFSEHVEKLKKLAIEKWASLEEIERIWYWEHQIMKKIAHLKGRKITSRDDWKKKFMKK